MSGPEGRSKREELGGWKLHHLNHGTIGENRLLQRANTAGEIHVTQSRLSPSVSSDGILCTISAAYEYGAVPICNSFASLQRLADFEGKAAQHAN